MSLTGYQNASFQVKSSIFFWGEGTSPFQTPPQTPPLNRFVQKTPLDPPLSCSADILVQFQPLRRIDAFWIRTKRPVVEVGGRWRHPTEVTWPINGPTPVSALYCREIPRPALTVFRFINVFESRQRTGSGNWRQVSPLGRSNLTKRKTDSGLLFVTQGQLHQRQLILNWRLTDNFNSR